LGGPIVCERPTALFHVSQPLEESVFFHVVMRRHATAVRNRPGQYRLKMATGDAPIEMDADPRKLSNCRHWRKTGQAERIPDHVPMPAKVTEVD
jgi:hypothetical protein